jgi:hypothetical protein
MLTSLTQAQFKGIVSKDEHKPVLRNVRYEPRKFADGTGARETGRLIATDGHKLIIYEVRCEKGDKPMTIPVDMFPVKINKAITDFQFRFKLKGKKIWVEDLVAQREEGRVHEDDQYPDVDAVFPSGQPMFDIGMDLDNMKMLGESFKALAMDNNNAKLSFFNSIGPVLVSSSGESSHFGIFRALLMPVRIEESSKWAGKDLVAKIKKLIRSHKSESLIQHNPIREALLHSPIFKTEVDKLLIKLLRASPDDLANDAMIRDGVYRALESKVDALMEKDGKHKLH